MNCPSCVGIPDSHFDIYVWVQFSEVCKGLKSEGLSFKTGIHRLKSHYTHFSKFSCRTEIKGLDLFFLIGFYFWASKVKSN